MVLRLFLFVLFMVTLVCAQTSSELKKAYGGSWKEVYIVRPGIKASFEFSDTGKAKKIVIEAEEKQDCGNMTVLPREKVEEVINELVPASERGKHLNSISFRASCASINVFDYDRVKIVVNETCPTSQGVVTDSIIEWKDR